MANAIYDTEFITFKNETKNRIIKSLCSETAWQNYKKTYGISRAKKGQKETWMSLQKSKVNNYTIFDPELISYAVDFGYGDAKRTFTGINGVTNKTAAFAYLKGAIADYFNNVKNHITDYKGFTNWHRTCCENFEDMLKVGNKSIICRGKSQKVLNMAFKYIFCFAKPKEEDYFKFCHMALDSYILNWYSRQIHKLGNNVKWSSLNKGDYYGIESAIYNKLQQALKYSKRNALATEPPIPLDKMMIKSEFIIWAYEVAHEQWEMVKNCLEDFDLDKIKLEHLSNRDRQRLKELIICTYFKMYKQH